MINIRSHYRWPDLGLQHSSGRRYQTPIQKFAIGAVLGICCLICLTGRSVAAESDSAAQPSSAGLEAARDEIENVRSNVFLTLVVLDKVRGEHEPGGPHYQAFTNQLARMEDLAKALARRAQEIKQRGDDYFAAWEARTAAIQNPDAKRQAEARFSERKASYDEIKRLMQEAKGNFLPFVAHLTEIKAILEGPRDQQSIARAKNLFATANWRSLDVQRSLMQMEGEFDKLAAAFGTEKAAQ